MCVCVPPSLRYFKATDPASWINVDRNNGELRVANTIDRESDFVQNGIYNITVRAVDASEFLVVSFGRSKLNRDAVTAAET